MSPKLLTRSPKLVATDVSIVIAEKAQITPIIMRNFPQPFICSPNFDMLNNKHKNSAKCKNKLEASIATNHQEITGSE